MLKRYAGALIAATACLFTCAASADDDRRHEDRPDHDRPIVIGPWTGPPERDLANPAVRPPDTPALRSSHQLADHVLTAAIGLEPDSPPDLDVWAVRVLA